MWDKRAMHLEHLSLANFRNYARLELDFPPNVGLFVGANGQGKSNLLEAIYYLATTRSYRAGSDRELINWLAANDPLPHARLVAKVRRHESDVQLELTLLGQPEKPGEEQPSEDEGAAMQLLLFQPPTASLQKRIRVNGVAKRAIDAIGQVNVVMFGPQDLDLVSGAPGLRRRYLDASLSQTNHRYVRTLQRYNRVVTQRNHLLRRIAHAEASVEELSYWDNELVTLGSYIVAARRDSLRLLDGMARDIHAQLTDGQEHLRVVYRSSLQTNGEIADSFSEALIRHRQRDIGAGVSLLGPHRDDLSFLSDGVDMRVYGSRGQQRTVALSLKFAEARYMCGVVGEEPILLLDDIMSELDEQRRGWVLHAIEGGGQVIVTATDANDYSSEFLQRAAMLRVESGLIERVE
jgi:DNA replication and repair protein RecF